MKHTKHPVTELASNTETLRRQAQSIHHQAANGAGQARKATEALASLDMETVFSQLREMVALVSKPNYCAAANAGNVVNFPSGETRRSPRETMAKAAE